MALPSIEDIEINAIMELDDSWEIITSYTSTSLDTAHMREEVKKLEKELAYARLEKYFTQLKDIEGQIEKVDELRMRVETASKATMEDKAKARQGQDEDQRESKEGRTRLSRWQRFGKAALRYGKTSLEGLKHFGKAALRGLKSFGKAALKGFDVLAWIVAPVVIIMALAGSAMAACSMIAGLVPTALLFVFLCGLIAYKFVYE